MRSRWPLWILLTAIALPARADDDGVRWLVSPDDDLDAWQRAAEAAWPGSGLTIERWTGAWPPDHADRPQDSPIAFLAGPIADGSVVLRAEEGVERQVRVKEADIAETGARRRVLLILYSMLHPIEVADNGWLPDSVEVVATTARESEAATRATTAEEDAARRRARILAEASVGLTARSGLDSPTLAPALRVGIQLAAFPRFRFLLATEISGDLLGQADLEGIGILFSGATFLVGNEFRFGDERLSVPVRVGLGGHVLWTHRTDNKAADVPALVPTVRGGIGLGWRVRAGAQLTVGIVLGADLIEGNLPIRIVSRDQSQESARQLSQLYGGLQIGITFGNVLEPMKDPRR